MLFGNEKALNKWPSGPVYELLRQNIDMNYSLLVLPATALVHPRLRCHFGMGCC